jgi:SAM-dependent methyltransferase
VLAESDDEGRVGSKDVDEQVRYWDAQAAAFDQEPDHGLRDPATRAAWIELLRQVLPNTPCRVADLGCGTGTLAVLMAQDGHDVTGVDLSSRMLAVAREKAKNASVQIDWHTGDVSDPPLARGGFDVIVSRHVLWALPDPAEALGRWIERLDERGCLVLIEGRWSTGAGLTAEQTTALVRSHRREVETISLDAEIFWGKPITDERYIVISRPSRRGSRR